MAAIDRIRAVLDDEARAIRDLCAHINDQADMLESAVKTIVSSCGEGLPGRLVTMGVGKAGLIARKIAATFASTGTPSLFVHPTEARHGDLGMIRENDVVLALSNSGASEEVIAIIPSLRHIGCTLLAIVGDEQSPLATHADGILSIGRVTEACPLGLAPSTSTTVMLALGDALALAVLEARAFTAEHYARFHPGGALGRKLMTCAEVMRKGNRMAIANPTTTISEAMCSISQARSGSVVLIDADARMAGVFTDGDLRRELLRAQDPAALLRDLVANHATRPGLRVRDTDLIGTALHIFGERHINELPVVDADGKPVGTLDVQDLADRGFAT
jgi:arabinose-5-phosphate isomerase